MKIYWWSEWPKPLQNSDNEWLDCAFRERNQIREVAVLNFPSFAGVIQPSFAMVQPNDCEPFVYFDRMVTINYYLLGRNIWNIYLFNF
jgi:hypothetical protein